MAILAAIWGSQVCSRDSSGSLLLCAPDSNSILEIEGVDEICSKCGRLGSDENADVVQGARESAVAEKLSHQTIHYAMKAPRHK